VTLQKAIDDGQLSSALAGVEERLRHDPASGEGRWQFFQLLCINGEWDRALVQLKTLAKLDPEFLIKAYGLRQAIECEAVRAEVFAGRQTPLVLGEPPEWLAGLVDALRAGCAGRYGQALELRNAALAKARPVPVRIDGVSAPWVADADGRLGPVLEVIVEGHYRWLPMENLRYLTLEPPHKLIDSVWLRASFSWASGGESAGLVPTRYPGAESHEDPLVRLGRVADWEEVGEGLHYGRGLRMLVTEEGYLPIAEVREIEFGPGSGDG